MKSILVHPNLVSLREQPLDRPQREEKATVMAFGREELEPVVFVEGLCILVLGVGDDGEGGDLA
jgi:hypothetical protein